MDERVSGQPAVEVVAPARLNLLPLLTLIEHHGIAFD